MLAKSKLLGVLGLLLAAVACSDDETQQAARSVGGEGESCTSRADCQSGLQCIGNVCLRSAPPEEDAGPPPVRLSQEGETCGARSDCEPGLACIAGVCSTGPSDPDAGAQTGVGQKGESCRTRIDCEAGLACIRSICTPADYPVQPTGKECVRIECRAAKDCCPTPSSSCTNYERYCNLGDPYYCSLFDTYCKCDEAAWSCTGDKCVFVQTCEPDAGRVCPSSMVCSGGKCVRCAKDDDCASGQSCIANECKKACTLDEECPVFHRCQSSQCVEVGCQTTRECVAYTKNPLAFCRDKSCREPCTSDLECNASSYNFRGCISGFCEDLGCETDEECRIRLNISQTSGQEAECRTAS
jgi:hypothetical protein